MRRVLLLLLYLAATGISHGAEISWEIETALAQEAQAGDVEAATELAQRLLTGANGGNPDIRGAIHWLEVAATAHHQPAQVILGDIYFFGIGVYPDYHKALAFYSPSADAGDLYAMVQMGVLYSRCGCDFHNPVRGLELFRRAAEAHYPPAYFNLGVSYEYGQGTPRDNLKAALWFERGVARGDAQSMTYLASLYRDGYGGIDKSLEKAFGLFAKGAALGDLDAAFGLGQAYSQGEGTPKDRDQARHWLLVAAEAGHGLAQEALGYSYLETAEDVAGDFDRAISWLETAGASGIGTAYNYLAQHFEMEMDYDKAYHYAELGSQSPNPDAAAFARALMDHLRDLAEHNGSST